MSFDKKKAHSPWDDPDAAMWIRSFDAWGQTLRLVQGTLQLKTKDNLHEIRAATSMVIMFCRENLWPTEDQIEREQIIESAVKQLSMIKQLFESKARVDSSLLSNEKYRDFMTSLDQEVRILEARISDPKPVMTNTPPVCWGEFWTNEDKPQPKKK